MTIDEIVDTIEKELSLIEGAGDVGGKLAKRLHRALKKDVARGFDLGVWNRELIHIYVSNCDDPRSIQLGSNWGNLELELSRHFGMN